MIVFKVRTDKDNLLNNYRLSDTLHYRYINAVID